jgi:hypothetical protein
MVKSISASKIELSRGMKWEDPLCQVEDFPKAQQLLWRALQAAATPQAAATAAAAVDAAVARGASTTLQQQQGLRLSSFSCDLPGATAMLAALPTHSLTHLHLDCSQFSDQANSAASAEALDGPELAAALAQLSHLKQLRLDNPPSTPSVLAALQAHSLTHLELVFIDAACDPLMWLDSVGNSAALAAALAQLSSLQHLRLACRDYPPHNLPGDCLTGVMQLSQLTSLTLECMWSFMYEPLQQLQLNVCCPAGVNLAAQKQLQSLSFGAAISWVSQLPASCVLPAQLAQLHCGLLQLSSDLSPILGLQQLQYLTLIVGGLVAGRHELLLQLQQLPALQHLTLQYEFASDALKSVPVWAQLLQLRVLHFKRWMRGPTRKETAPKQPQALQASKQPQALQSCSWTR